MPSKRKRIGYLPSLNIQEIITNIANEEKISQSKLVGILVQEALIARGLVELKNTDDLISKRTDSIKNKINNSTYKYRYIDELISDKGITYNTKKYPEKSDSISSRAKVNCSKDLFELFKQFILFQNMLNEEK